MKKIIDLDNHTDYPLNLEELENFTSLILRKEKVSESASLSLLLIKSDEMQELNYKWRGRNSATDVLSFPCEFRDSAFLGDIIIDIETASRQKGKSSMSYEIRTLFLHGLLHLLGYDHLSRADADIMEEKEINYRKFIKE